MRKGEVGDSGIRLVYDRFKRGVAQLPVVTMLLVPFKQLTIYFVFEADQSFLFTADHPDVIGTMRSKFRGINYWRIEVDDASVWIFRIIKNLESLPVNNVPRGSATRA